jgi:hypothetical protein
MTKLVGFVGVSGSGKTTLCKQFEDAENVAFVKTTVSEIYKRMGKDPKVAMTIDERLDVQEVILKELKMQWAEAIGNNQDKEYVLTDRTPYCFIAFMLAEVSGYGELTEKQNKRIVQYVMDCQCAGLMFDCIFHLPPFPPKEWKREEDGKVCAQTSPSYNLHFDFIMQGLMSSHQVHCYKIYGYPLGGRAQYVNNILTERMKHSV